MRTRDRLKQRQTKQRERLKSKRLKRANPFEYYSRKIDRWIERRWILATLLNFFLLAMTAFAAWMIFRSAMKRAYFEFVEPLVSERVFAIVLRVWGMYMPLKVQFSESVVAKIWEKS